MFFNIIFMSLPKNVRTCWSCSEVHFNGKEILFVESYWKKNKVNCLFEKKEKRPRKIFTFFFFLFCEIYEIFCAIILREKSCYANIDRLSGSDLSESIMKSKWKRVTPFVCLRPLVIHSSCPTAWPSILLPWETICLERTIWRGEKERIFPFFRKKNIIYTRLTKNKFI